MVGRGIELRHVETIEQLAAPVQDADVRTVELVRRARQQITVERGCVDQYVWCVVDSIHERECAHGMCQTSRPLDVGNGAQRVRRGTNRHQLRARTEAPFEIGPIQLAALRFHLHRLDRHAALPRQRLPWGDVCVVIELGDDDLVPGAPASPERPRHMERDRRHVGAEGDLVWRRPEECPEPAPRVTKQDVGLLTGRITPVRVRVVMQQVIHDRVGHDMGHLRAAGAVEVRDGQAAMLAEQRREGGANRFNAGDRIGRKSGVPSVHHTALTLPCSPTAYNAETQSPQGSTSDERCMKKQADAATRPPSASARVAGFIARFDPSVARIVRSARTMLRKRMPTAIELVYDNYNALAIGFSSTDRTSDVIVSLAVYARGVNLYFIYGASLPDPDRALEGQGTQGRFVRLPDAARLDDPAVKALLHAAIEDSDPPLPATGRTRTIVKSVSAKQRPRRPAASTRLASRSRRG